MIFGVGYPVVEIINSSVIIELSHGAIFPKFKDKRILENESPINGVRSWVDLWNHAEFEVTVHIHESDDPIGYFNILLAIEDQLVYFKPHKYIADRSSLNGYITDSMGLPVPFKCTNFEPYYLKNVNHFDCLDLTFKSSLPVILDSRIIGILKP
jgi:hypothetical protein